MSVEVEKEMLNAIFAARDEEYADFTAKLIPNVPRESIIGVRTPQLRSIAKRFGKNAGINEFLSALPHEYHEQNLVHAYIAESIGDFDYAVKTIEAFLPYVTNWAVCDSMTPRIFAKHTGELLPIIKKWLQSAHPYTVRFGLRMLMCFYLEKEFASEINALAASVCSEEYYVNMMQAWYFATALAKQYDSTVPFAEEHRLSPWVHNKTIQKAVESFRITAEQKAHLKTLRLNLRRKGAKNEPVSTSKSDSNESKRIEVVAAIIEKDGKILICRRAENKTRALKWEFPGGKIEPGETPEQAVLRECREELDVDLCVKGEFMRVLHSYPDIEIQLTVFRTAIIGSDPRCIEHKEIRFVYPSELADFELCPADITVAEKIISEAHLF
jgi:mutator protein MutT